MANDRTNVRIRHIFLKYCLRLEFPCFPADIIMVWHKYGWGHDIYDRSYLMLNQLRKIDASLVPIEPNVYTGVKSEELTVNIEQWTANCE